MDKYKFVENMITERYNTDEEIQLRKCHLFEAMRSFKFRNDEGIYYWHGDDARETKPKPIIII